MLGDEIRFCDKELALVISSLEPAARIMPEAEVGDRPLLAEKMSAVDSSARSLRRIADQRGLRV